MSAHTTQARLEAKAYAAIQRKDWPSAAAALHELTTLVPNSARAWIELSYVESFRGHYRAASNAIATAARIPRLAGTDLADVLARLRTFNDAAMVREISRTLLQATSPDSGLLAACAMHLSNLNDHALALECARMAVAVDQGGIAPRLVRGQMLAQHGDLDAAAADFDWCLARAPGLASAWWALSRLGRQTADNNHVPALRKLLARHGLGHADVAYASFALHKELDDLGDIDGAWAALQRACTAKRATLKYAIEDSRTLVDALVAMPTAALARPPLPAADANGRVPLFIVGMHRSGTTLLEQLLDGSPQVRGVGELYDFTSAMRYATDHHCRGVIDGTIVARASTVDFTEVGQRYLQGMAWRLGDERFFTDKLPSNFLNIGFICRALPQAKILHMVRDPVETCFSNLRELFSDANPYSYDQLELADFFLQYRRLMAHWHGAYPGRILDVDYAALTRDPEAVMREVAAFCGIDYIDAMRDPRSSTRAISTASAVQVRDRVVRREVPKWAPYAKHLQPLISVLRQGGVEIPELPA